MKTLKDYIINFVGLEAGSHDYEFLIDNEFFENFETSEISESQIQVTLLLLKDHNMLSFDFKIKGYANLVCEKCLEDFQLEIDGKEQLFVKFGPEYQEVSDNVIILPIGEDQIDVSQFIFEYIHLGLPISKTHEANKQGNNNQCNQEALEKLEEYVSDTYNEEEDDDDDVDPRWEVLKKLK